MRSLEGTSVQPARSEGRLFTIMRPQHVLQMLVVLSAIGAVQAQQPDAAQVAQERRQAELDAPRFVEVLLAKADGVSLNRFIAVAVTKKVGVLEIGSAKRTPGPITGGVMPGEWRRSRDDADDGSCISLAPGGSVTPVPESWDAGRR